MFKDGCNLHQQGEYLKAENIYRQLLDLFPTAFLLNYNLGLLLQEQHRFQDALDCYLTAAQDNPDDPDLFFNTGLCYKQTGKPETAILSFNKSLEIQPESIDTLYNIGSCYRQLNLFEETIKYYTMALKIDEDYQPALSNIAYTYHRLEKNDKALYFYKKLLQLNPHHKGARHMVATITGSPSETIDNQYVAELFDNYSNDFEEDLRDKLQYRVPELIKEELLKIVGPNHQFNNVLDLGCGTGLAGEQLHTHCKRLHGVDLSEGMISKAKEKNIYTQLQTRDIITFLHESGEKYDLFLAADVFSYIGKLEETFAAIQSTSRAKGYLAFSVERTEEENNLELGKTGRFKHSRNYIEKLCNEYGFEILAEKTSELRLEKGEWVKGILFILLRLN